MNLLKIEGLLIQLNAILDTDEETDPNAIQDLLLNIYEEAMQKYRPVLSALPGVAEKTGNDVAEIITVFLRFANTIGDDDSFQEELGRSQTRKAKRYFMALKSYQDAGFNDEQAMQILLTSIANEKSYLKMIPKQIPQSTKKQENQQ